MLAEDNVNWQHRFMAKEQEVWRVPGRIISSYIISINHLIGVILLADF